MTILYTQTNYSRKPKFRIMTSIKRSKIGLLVEKKALSQTGRQHISNLKKSQLYISRAYPQIHLPRTLKSTKELIQNEYITGINLQVELEKALFSKNYAQTECVIANFLNFVASLPAQKVSSKEYGEFANLLSLSKSKAQYFNKMQLGLNPGLLDLKLGNLIRHSTGDMYFVDLEWVYDFYIPIQFIVWRTLFNILNNLQLLIQYATCQNYPSYKLSDICQCPVRWWKMFNFSIAEYRLFAEWEMIFQKYVDGRMRSVDYVIYPNIIKTSQLSLDDKFETISSNIPNMLAQLKDKSEQISHLTQQINSQTEVVELKEEIAIVHTRVTSLEKDLNIIQSSKFYRLWQIYCKFLRDLHLKK